jgi:hypothetical protein
MIEKLRKSLIDKGKKKYFITIARASLLETFGDPAGILGAYGKRSFQNLYSGNILAQSNWAVSP